jgi:hypothetical protein
MKEVLATLKDVDQRTDAATLTLQLWTPGDRLKEIAVLAVAMVLEGRKPE